MPRRLVNIGPRESLGTAAWASLQPRLRSVQRFLRRAARRGNQQLEGVHQLRVATRRAHAALLIYAELMRGRDFRWWNRRLKRMRRTAGAARDRDVLLSYFQASDMVRSPALRAWILQRLADERRAAQRPIRRLAARFQKKNWSRRRKQLRRRLLRVPAGQQPFGPWAERQLVPRLTAFWHAAPTANASYDDLHQFRIETKKLRYAIELLGSVFPPAVRTSILTQLESVQQLLGELNDCQARLQHLDDWRGELAEPALQLPLADLADQEQLRLAQFRRTFMEWWSSESLKLQQALSDVRSAEPGAEAAVPA